MEAALGTEQYWAGLQSGLEEDAVLVTDSGQGPWGQVLLTRDQMLFADEPLALMGRNSGPRPTDVALMALGACTAITLRMYAARKTWTIDRITVRLKFGVAEGGGPDFMKIDRVIEIDGPLDDAQRARLFEIAEKCPVHRMMTGSIAVRSELTAAS